MKATAAALLAALLLTGAAAAQNEPLTPALPLTPAAGQPADKPAKADKKPVYDENADAKQQIGAALAKAKKDNRRVLIQWGANWCGWCIKLHDLYGSNKDIKHELLYEYDLVFVDIGKWDKNMDLAMSYGADLKKIGVPYLTFLDADGKVLANADTSPLESKDQKASPGHDPALVLALLTKHQAPYLQASAILDDGLAQAKASGRKIFLHFGAPWCPWCHVLENWMAQPEIHALLAKDFVDVKIDQDRNVGAQDVFAKYNPNAEKSGIPWFVFTDAEGKSIVTSDSPKGNIGYPGSDSEIDYFAEMLKKSATKLTPDDIAALIRSLREARTKAGAGH